MSEVPVRRTEWTTPELLAAYAIAWRAVVGGEPSRYALALLWAQASLECARGGRSCWNHNVGNVMALGSYAGDFHVLRGAPECFPAGKVPAGWKEQPSNIACGPGQVSAVPATGSKFRAYPSFLDGCADKLRVLDRQWPRAIVALSAATGPADADAFVLGLVGPPRYFTASSASYAGQLRSLAGEILRTLAESDWPTPAPHDTDPPDTLPESPTGKSSQTMKAVVAPIIDWSPDTSGAATPLRAGEGEHHVKTEDPDL